MSANTEQVPAQPAATAATAIACKTSADIARTGDESGVAPSPRTRRRGIAIPNDAGNLVFPSPNPDLENDADCRRAPKLAATRTRGASLPEQGEHSSRASSSSSAQLFPATTPGTHPPSPVVVDATDARTSEITGPGQFPRSKASLPGQVSSGSLPHLGLPQQPGSPVQRRPRVLSWKAQSSDHLSVPKPGTGLGVAPKDSVSSDGSGRRLGVLDEHPISNVSFSLSEEQDEGAPLATELDRKRTSATPSASNSQLLVPSVRVNSMPAHAFTSEEVFGRHIDAERDEEEINKASCYIEDALEGRYKHGKGNLLSKAAWKRRCFDVHTSFAWATFIYVINIVFACLIVIEPPTTCDTPVWVHGVVEMLCLLIFCSDIALKIAYMGKKGYLSKKWHKLSCGLLLLYFVDMVVFLSLSRQCNNAIRIARPLRPWLLLARNRRLRRVVDTTVRMTLPLIRVFFAMALFIFLFAWIGVHLYQDAYHEKYLVVDTCEEQTCANMSAQSTPTSQTAMSPQSTSPGVSTQPLTSTVAVNGSSDTGESVQRRAHLTFENAFDNPLNASLHLFVLLTSENYPYIMEPALAANRANVAYFIIYYIACIQLTALNLAVIVQFWIARLSSIGLAEKRKQRLGLAQAFMLLDPQGNGFITEGRWSKVVCRLKSDMDRLKAKFVFDLLDFEQKGCLDVLDFLNISELFNINIKQLDLEEIQKPIPFWKASLRSFLYAPLFKIRRRQFYMNQVLLTLVILHSVLVSIYYRGLSPVVQDNLHIVCSVIVAVFAVEVFIKLLAGGEHKYVIAGNAALVAVAVASMTTYWAVESSHRSTPALIWGLSVALRVFWLSRTFQFLLLYLTRVSRVTFWQVAVTAGFIYTLSDLGMQTMAQDSAAFRNSSAAQCSSTAPEDKRGFNRYPYDCSLGFDSVYCSMHAMMQIVTTNDWHVPMADSARVVGEWVIAYYIATYVIIHYVFINLMVAIAIEMFLLAIKTKFFSTVESRLVETHVANFEVVAESSHKMLKTVRKRSNSIVRGHVAAEDASVDPITPISSAIDLEDFAVARRKTVVLQISKKNHSLVEEFKSFIEDNDFEDEELTDIQKLYDNMMKKSRRSDTLTTSQGYFDAVALQREKKLARARLERPDLLIYALASIRGREDVLQASGCLVLEVDGHANVASFSCTVKGLTGFVTDSFIHTSDKTTPMFILPEFEYDPDRGIYSSHGVWKLKHVDRAMLLSERSIVTLCTQQHPQGECGGLIRVEEEITQWEEKKKDLKAKCEQFSKISPILTLYAHRVEKRTLEDMLMNRQGLGTSTGAHILSSANARTDGDGQSSSSMTSILTEWKTSTQSIQQDLADEQTVAPDTNELSDRPPQALKTAVERKEEDMSASATPEEPSKEIADGEALLPSVRAVKAMTSSHPKSTSFSLSHPGTSKASVFSRLRGQVHSDTFLNGESVARHANKKSKPELRNLEHSHKPSRFSVIENLVNTEHRRRLVSHGSLFVSPDVQSIERLTSTKRQSRVNARSEARRKWQRLAMLRVNKVGIAPTTQQQRIINEEIKKPEVDEVASKTSTSSALKRTTSVASAMLKTLSTAVHPKFPPGDLSSPVRQSAKRSMTNQQPTTPAASGRRGSFQALSGHVHAGSFENAKPPARPKTAGLAHSNTHRALGVGDVFSSVSDTQLSPRQGEDTKVQLLPRKQSRENLIPAADADRTESTV